MSITKCRSEEMEEDSLHFSFRKEKMKQKLIVWVLIDLAVDNVLRLLIKKIS